MVLSHARKGRHTDAVKGASRVAAGLEERLTPTRMTLRPPNHARLPFASLKSSSI